MSWSDEVYFGDAEYGSDRVLSIQLNQACHFHHNVPSAYTLNFLVLFYHFIVLVHFIVSNVRVVVVGSIK
jgi:hypothetical protein